MMFQAQKELSGKVVFDYYTMGSFESDSVIASIRDMGGKIKEENVRNNRLVGHILLPFLFYKYLKLSDYEIIHVHADTAWKLLLFAIPAKHAGVKKVIVHSHSSNISGDFRWLKFLCHKVAKPVLPIYADELLGCSDKAIEWMYPRKYQYKVTKIHNGIDSEKFSFDFNCRVMKREELGIEKDEIVIGTVGDFSYAKNPLALLRIFKKIISIHENYKLVYVGDGAYRKNIEEFAKKLDICDKVVFTGKCNELKCIYSAMDIFVLTSRFEGLPVSAIEAQSNGLYCVLSDNITEEVDICGRCTFADVNDSEQWVDIIHKMAEKSTNWYRNSEEYYLQRIQNVSMIKLSRFDSAFMTEVLLSVYTQGKTR